MPDTEYIDIETATLTHLQGDAWLSNTANVGLLHRHPRAYVPGYRQGQLPAIAIGIDAEGPELRPAGGVVERRIRLAFEFIHAGGNLTTMTEHLQEVMSRTRERLRILSLPTPYIGILDDALTTGDDLAAGQMPNEMYVMQGSGALECTLIQEYDPAPDASGPSITPATEVVDVKAGIVTALTADATVNGAAGLITRSARVQDRNNPQAQYPLIEVFAEGAGADTRDTFQYFERPVSGRIVVTGRGGDLDTVEDTVKKLLAGSRRVLRSEAMKGAPIGGAACDIENTRMQMQDDPEIDEHTIVGITEFMAELAA